MTPDLTLGHNQQPLILVREGDRRKEVKEQKTQFYQWNISERSERMISLQKFGSFGSQFFLAFYLLNSCFLFLLHYNLIK